MNAIVYELTAILEKSGNNGASSNGFLRHVSPLKARCGVTKSSHDNRL
jgi:hypothetical protein